MRVPAKVSPFWWNVLLVEPWTPAHAPVATVYQPAPVLVGACGCDPPPFALAPVDMSPAISGKAPWRA